MMGQTPEARPECPACGGCEMTSCYRVDAVPVHSVLLMETREEALAYPRGRIELHHCGDCGFAFNAAFELCQLSCVTRAPPLRG